jgi:hypothetical protein
MMTFPVWVLMVFTYGAGMSGYTWFYSYNTATNYIVKDEMTCRLGAQDSPGQHALCAKANNKEDLDYFCGEKIPRPCYFKVPKDLMMGRYGPVFLTFNEQIPLPQARINYSGRNPNP